jgi:hypothetical protein
MRNAEGDLINKKILVLLIEHENREELADAIVGNIGGKYDQRPGLVEILTKKDAKSFKKVFIVASQIAVLSSPWMFFRVVLFRNRWLLNRRVKDEVKLCSKYIADIYK